MERLEEHLRLQRIPLSRLETGVKQPEALGLYRRLGYLERAPFGKYQIDPLSVFMEKRISL
jgi:putative acetyltransferase